MNKSIFILAIESSCDETSVAIIENGSSIKANIVASQVKSHVRFGGVVPEVASRHHVEQISQLIGMAIKKSGISGWGQIDAVAVTQGPGLVGPLLVGVTAAKTLAYIYHKPLIAVNHLAGHIYSSRFMSELKFPLLALIVSGGHTELVYMEGDHRFEVVGETQDDAVGEAYDKVGRLLDLPYPAGKYLDVLAQKGDPRVYEVPRAMIDEENLDFSFSGMKSAVMNIVHNANQRGETIQSADLAAGFQLAVIEVIETKVRRALRTYPQVKQFVLAGGVAANSGIRTQLRKMMDEEFSQVEMLIPPLSLCGDNAAMIGAAAYPLFCEEQFSNLTINAKPGLML
ncbi:tRNA (adenosine(37)-N6)-threonylcarbamoyltransferase complex transferase subunit TsaD [Facklamia sp. DSM 111018]|uniref:tRNA N6-adenosine threonylcarbamoyltransferase n=1 Tax=Facklamia lactis TaxID=2749967 RepID=A0ABS0LSW8_9LACT|nr:tRNA (adenosine(37)-N6)-threonylcarbamoyltransferase complex transferase subunit TsaD [Facklamia lactis]MBG9980736.1 tRNA (adenosine(37)-N6)-threonylcarbamoyltransferase complex transferase subunit TsaD [Facklamia lactis]MBG9986550.1 tRNA (adenosine(37)-N6)-threonylcarbamoyltransferase complex transferase subunit TsaD [Facklamia lactis]